MVSWLCVLVIPALGRRDRLVVRAGWPASLAKWWELLVQRETTLSQGYKAELWPPYVHTLACSCRGVHTCMLMYMCHAHTHTNYICPYPHTQYTRRNLSKTVFLNVTINSITITQEILVSNAGLDLVPISKRGEKKGD